MTELGIFLNPKETVHCFLVILYIVQMAFDIGVKSLVVSAPTYCAYLSMIPVSWSCADPAPLSPPTSAFLSPLYCPVPTKAENTHKYFYIKKKWLLILLLQKKTNFKILKRKNTVVLRSQQNKTKK